VFDVPQETVTAAISSVLKQVTVILENGALVVIFLVLLLAGGHRTAARRDVLPAAACGIGAGLQDEIAGHVQRYTLQMILLSAVTGVLVGGTLAILGVRFALVFGFLAFLLNFIPTIGAIVATLLPLPVVLLGPQLSVTTQVLALAIPAVIQAFIGNFIQPRLLGRSFGLHPVSILLALIFFGMIWGLVGAFLATPITAVIKIVLERIPATRFIGELLAGTYGEAAEPPDLTAT
jgi:AI-2 transport protein TqsA